MAKPAIGNQDLVLSSGTVEDIVRYLKPWCRRDIDDKNIKADYVKIMLRFLRYAD